MVDSLAPWVIDWLDHPDPGDPYWTEVDAIAAAGRTSTTVLHLAGWYDFWVGDALAWFRALRAAGVPQRIVIGPWFHGSFGGTISGSLDFGTEAAADLFEEERKWHDHWLRDLDNGAETADPVRIFVMGVNRWRDEAD
jgi:hypothetical protein